MRSGRDCSQYAVLPVLQGVDSFLFIFCEVLSRAARAEIILGEDIVDAGKVDLPLAGVDFRYSSQRGFAVIVCGHFARTR